MEILEARIRSRFEWGLMADIGYPDYETRMAILRRKVEFEKINLSDEILNYSRKNIKSNIREIEGALQQAIAYSNLEKQRLPWRLRKRSPEYHRPGQAKGDYSPADHRSGGGTLLHFHRSMVSKQDANPSSNRGRSPCISARI